MLGGTITVGGNLASLSIGRTFVGETAVIGTTNNSDSSGFTAQSISSFKAGLFTAPLTAATDLPIQLAPLTEDVQIREV